jgi:hypothetical protein
MWWKVHKQYFNFISQQKWSFKGDNTGKQYVSVKQNKYLMQNTHSKYTFRLLMKPSFGCTKPYKRVYSLTIAQLKVETSSCFVDFRIKYLWLLCIFRAKLWVKFSGQFSRCQGSNPTPTKCESAVITTLLVYNYYSNKMHSFFIIKSTRYYSLYFCLVFLPLNVSTRVGHLQGAQCQSLAKVIIDYSLLKLR